MTGTVGLRGSASKHIGAERDKLGSILDGLVEGGIWPAVTKWGLEGGTTGGAHAQCLDVLGGVLPQPWAAASS